jgi:hypothetical protein
MTSAGNNMYFFTSDEGTAQSALRSLPGFTLTANVEPAGAGTVTGTGVYPVGVRAKLTAVPALGFVFQEWSHLPQGGPHEPGITATSNLSVTARFLAGLGFAGWMTTFATAEDQQGPLANPSGDGILNLLKYASNLDPGISDRHLLEPGGTSGLPVLRETAAGLRLEYLERQGGFLRYEPQASGTLDSWSPLEGGTERIRLNYFWTLVRIAVPAETAGNFVRVKVSMIEAAP